jgi:hypothetical protein
LAKESLKKEEIKLIIYETDKKDGSLQSSHKIGGAIYNNKEQHIRQLELFSLLLEITCYYKNLF